MSTPRTTTGTGPVGHSVNTHPRPPSRLSPAWPRTEFGDLPSWAGLSTSTTKQREPPGQPRELNTRAPHPPTSLYSAARPCAASRANWKSTVPDARQHPAERSGAGLPAYQAAGSDGHGWPTRTAWGGLSAVEPDCAVTV